MSGLMFIFIGAAVAATPAPAEKPPKGSALFSQGAETFQLKNEKNQTPVFRLLDESPGSRALAVAVATALNQSPDTNPKIPVHEYLEVTVDQLTVKPAKKTGELEVMARVSGHEMDIPKPISREAFLAGKSVEMVFPPTSKEVSVFSLKSEAKLKLHLDKKSNELVIENANGHVAFNSPLTGEGDEKIHFTGRGQRVTR